MWVGTARLYLYIKVLGYTDQLLWINSSASNISMPPSIRVTWKTTTAMVKSRTDAGLFKYTLVAVWCALYEFVYCWRTCCRSCSWWGWWWSSRMYQKYFPNSYIISRSQRDSQFFQQFTFIPAKKCLQNTVQSEKVKFTIDSKEIRVEKFQVILKIIMHKHFKDRLE